MLTKIEKVDITTPLHEVEAGIIVTLASQGGEFLTITQDCDTQAMLDASGTTDTLVILNIRYSEIQTMLRDSKATIIGKLTYGVL